MAIYKSEPTIEEKQRDKMLRYEYGMYVMLTSYFKKGSFSNKIVHDRLKLNYLAVSASKQCDLEEIVLDSIDNFIIPKITRKIKDIENKEVVVSAKRRLNSEEHILIFEGEGFKFAFTLEEKFNHKEKKPKLLIHFLDEEDKSK